MQLYFIGRYKTVDFGNTNEGFIEKYDKKYAELFGTDELTISRTKKPTVTA